MSIEMARLSEVAALYGLTANPVLIDSEICLAGGGELFAVHSYLGSGEEIVWIGSCLEKLGQLSLKGLSRIIRTPGGSFAGEVNRGKFFLTEYVPGAACDSGNIFEVRSIGRLIGQVHAASEEVLHLFPSPPSKIAPSWREAARERAAYWRLAIHRFRQGERGEAVKQLLRCAEESLGTMDDLGLHYDGARVLSFAHPVFNKFVYLTAGHQVYSNFAYQCHVDWPYTSVGTLLIDGGYPNDRMLHFLASYIAYYPLASMEWELLFAYLLYPHEWAGALDELTRGRPSLVGRDVLAQLQEKTNWLEWLREQSQILPRLDKSSTAPSQMEPPKEEKPLVQAAETPALNKLEKIVWKLFPKGKNKARGSGFLP